VKPAAVQLAISVQLAEITFKRTRRVSVNVLLGVIWIQLRRHVILVLEIVARAQGFWVPYVIAVLMAIYITKEFVILSAPRLLIISMWALWAAKVAIYPVKPVPVQALTIVRVAHLET